jgi:DNA-binding MarR family transcriptional regulator
VVEPETVASELRVVLGRIVRRLRAERVQRRGLPLAQVLVLGRLDRGGPSGISALAAAEHIRPQSMAATVAALEEAGLVARHPVAIDLTPAGREMLAADRAQRVGWLAEAIRTDLNAREQKVLAEATRLLARLVGD